ncbi:[Fe-Fe] hydrogenase large subunit C-terminal domain-containing protein [Huintestinicola sp.]|uniref:[Fe-Fe] hydrogenase large subunit C-terminal domain-containing protein n=1 Tax=Huintestinicola sp. TaxID=2981661 RepID=UPI003D7DDD72
MNDIIIVNPEKCVGCNACVRNCPAQEANVTKRRDDGTFVTTVNPDKCICCGECVRSCQHGARDYKDDTEAYIDYLSRNKTALLVAPAIKTVFPTNWKGVLNWFKKKGVLIYDVSYGADICTWAHLRAIEGKRVGNVITQPCAAIVNYIETYQPKLINNLSPVHSPISCEAIYLKRYIGVKYPLAVLSPCIAKKTEFLETGLVDFSITFGKLKQYFEKNNIHVEMNQANDDFDYPFEDQQGQVGAVYPRPGGLRDNLWLHDPDLNITTSEGVHKVYPEIDMYAEMPEFKHPEVFDVLSCEFGCNVGPASATDQTVFDVMAVMRDVEKAAKKKRKTGLFGGGEDKLFKKFDDTLNISDFLRSYKPRARTITPTEAQLEPIYVSMGKITDEDRHYDCHACGYSSCREMATAVYRGLNVPDNCIVHAKSVLNEKHKELSHQHDVMYMMANKCREFSDNLVQDIDSITRSLHTIEESAAQTGGRTVTVKQLIESVIKFCSANETMDVQTVKQLISIMESICTAFDALDKSVSDTTKGSGEISGSVSELTRLVEELNVMLHETTAVDKY